jgi:hypothetical protein
MRPRRGEADVWWRCRCCLRLSYHSQRLAPLDRLQHRRRCLADGIARGKIGWGELPERPKGKHWTRYERELERVEAIDRRLDALFLNGATRLLQRHTR